MNFTEKIEEILQKEAQAILDMQLKRLQGLEREKLDRLAAFLYEKETITGEEFMHILGE